MKKLFKYLFLIPTLSVLVVSLFIGYHYIDSSVKKSDCAVIFGAAVWRDDIPSHALYDRIVTAIKLYQDKKVDCLVLSGGDSDFGSHEVDVMKKLLLEVDIPTKDMRLDYQGTDTQKTIKNLDKNFSYILVSNDFHLARIRLFTWRYGLTNSQFKKANYHYGRYFKEPYFFFREVLAIFWYFKFEILFLWGIVYFMLKLLKKQR